MKKIIHFMLSAVFVLFFYSSCFAIGVGDLQDLITLTARDLANQLVGPANVGPLPLNPPDFTGSEFAAGIFTNGLVDGLGINQGVILSTGDIFNAVGPNLDPSSGLDNAQVGLAALNALIVPGVTANAMALDFFLVPPARVTTVRFKYAFASDEYSESVGTGFNDVFAIFIDGQNIALVPGTNNPVSVNTLNGTATPLLFNNNTSGLFGTQYDGFSSVLKATATVTPGVAHLVRLAIADGGPAGAPDSVVDSAVLIAPATSFFEDIPLTHFAVSHTMGIFNAGITVGCSADPALFCPDNGVTRGQMAAFIARAENGGDPTVPCATPPFTDVPITDPFCPHIQFIKTAGISLGFADGTFRPIDPVTRGQMAAFIVRGVEGEPVGACSVAPFLDVPTNYVFCRHVERLKALAITLGFPDGTYQPENGTLRDEMAVFLGRGYLALP
ncbi:MAG: hypothetical protein A2V86_04730 [Deltaproteobacteria bacterium RBG_16_49_23]|nr:MAG: hypothetical protein A2V86_04730 [Deltaproteobacteria bacterium RBG_16_49_23]